MLTQTEQRVGRPTTWLADGGYVSHAGIDAVAARGVALLAPVPRQRGRPTPCRARHRLARGGGVAHADADRRGETAASAARRDRGRHQCRCAHASDVGAGVRTRRFHGAQLRPVGGARAQRRAGDGDCAASDDVGRRPPGIGARTRTRGLRGPHPRVSRHR